MELPMGHAPIILVPGFWLGAWAWDDVADLLRSQGHDVTPLTLPGMGSVDDRADITFDDHVDAIVGAVTAAATPPVLVLHSAAGYSGYVASDRTPEGIAAVVYVDTAPGKPPMDPDQEGDKALVWDELVAGENLDGLSEAQLASFRERAVPVPGAVLRGTHDFTNDARLDIPSTLVATGFSSEEYRTYAQEHPDWSFLAGLMELRDVDYIDLPTSHWPMWSKPTELADIIGAVAVRTAAD